MLIEEITDNALTEQSSSSLKVVYKMDIDYEAKLFQPDYEEKGTAKTVKEWEYVYFLLQQNPFSVLKNIKEYDAAYLDGLRSLGFSVGDIDPSASNFKYFWGHHHDLEIERRLNSKLTSAEIALKNNWGFVKGIHNGCMYDIHIVFVYVLHLYRYICIYIIDRPSGAII